MQQINGFQVHRHHDHKIKDSLKTIIDKGAFSVIIEQVKTDSGVTVSVAITPVGHLDFVSIERSLEFDSGEIGQPEVTADEEDKNCAFAIIPSCSIEMRKENATMLVDIWDKDWENLLGSASADTSEFEEAMSQGRTFIKRQRRVELDDY
jgi:hypothetical protein